MDEFTLKVNKIVDQKLSSMTNMETGQHAHNGYDVNQIDPAVGLTGFPVIQVANATVAPTDTPVSGTFRFYVDTTPNYILWVYTVYQNTPAATATSLIGAWKAITMGSLISSGTYTPTLTGVTNVAGSTAYACQYLRVGSTVTVSGKVDIDPTAAAPTLTQLGISLPIASNFGAAEQCGGTGSSPASNQQGGIYADATNDRAQLDFSATDTANRSWYWSFTYQLI